MERIPKTSVAIIPLALLGLGVSGYLAYEHYVAPIACIGRGCALVDQSPYSEIFAVPLSVLGLICYGSILGLAIGNLRAQNPLSTHLQLGILGLALVGTIFSAYLIYLEFAVIQAFCTWCTISAVTIAAILVLSTLGLPRRPRHSPR